MGEGEEGEEERGEEERGEEGKEKEEGGKEETRTQISYQFSHAKKIKQKKHDAAAAWPGVLVEDLDDAGGEPALGRLGDPLHEQDHLVVLRDRWWGVFQLQAGQGGPRRGGQPRPHGGGEREQNNTTEQLLLLRTVGHRHHPPPPSLAQAPLL